MRPILYVSVAIAFLVLGIAHQDARLLAQPAPIPTRDPCLGDCCGDVNGDAYISTGEATLCIKDLVNRLAFQPFTCTICGAITTADCTKVVLNLLNRVCGS